MRTNTYVFPLVSRTQPSGPPPRRPPKAETPPDTPPDTPPVTLLVTPKEPREEPRKEPREEPARDPRLATARQVDYALSLALEHRVLDADHIDEARTRWLTSDRVSITLRICHLRAGTAPRFQPSPPPVVPLSLTGLQDQHLPLDGDAIGEAEAAEATRAEQIRIILEGPMAARMPPASIEQQQADLERLEAHSTRSLARRRPIAPAPDVAPAPTMHGPDGPRQLFFADDYAAS